MYRCRTQVQHELVAELVNRGVLTSAGAEEVCHDLIGDKRALASERRRKQAAVALLHVDHARGRAVDLTASQQQKTTEAHDHDDSLQMRAHGA